MLLYGAILAQTSSKTCLVALYFNFQFVWIFYFFFVVDFLYNGLVVKLQSDFFLLLLLHLQMFRFGLINSFAAAGLLLLFGLQCDAQKKNGMSGLSCFYWNGGLLMPLCLYGIFLGLGFFEVCDSMRFVILWSLWLYEDCDSMKIELYEDWDSMKIGIIWGLGFYEDLDFFWSVSFKVEDCNSL